MQLLLHPQLLLSTLTSACVGTLLQAGERTPQRTECLSLPLHFRQTIGVLPPAPTREACIDLANHQRGFLAFGTPQRHKAEHRKRCLCNLIFSQSLLPVRLSIFFLLISSLISFVAFLLLTVLLTSSSFSSLFQGKQKSASGP